MSYKDMLIFLDPTPSSDERLKMAIRLAKAHSARLIGIDASADVAFEGTWRDRALQVGRYFEEMTEAAGIEAKLVGADYRHGGTAPDYTHCVDLVIAPRPEGESRRLVAAFVPDEVVMRSGCPTLVVPHDWAPGPVGESVVVAWNGSREATRAVHDALPLLETARKVVVFAFSQRPSALRASAEALAQHLKRHGVKVTLSDWTNTGEISAIEAMFASIDTQDCDLIVAGGFGHSRVFEGLFGGVSFDPLKQPTLPVLMSH